MDEMLILPPCPDISRLCEALNRMWREHRLLALRDDTVQHPQSEALLERRRGDRDSHCKTTAEWAGTELLGVREWIKIDASGSEIGPLLEQHRVLEMHIKFADEREHWLILQRLDDGRTFVIDSWQCYYDVRAALLDIDKDPSIANMAENRLFASSRWEVAWYPPVEWFRGAGVTIRAKATTP